MQKTSSFKHGLYFVADHIPGLRSIGETCLDFLNKFTIPFTLLYSIRVPLRIAISPVTKSELATRYKCVEFFASRTYFF
jgi:hypothetical protein